MDTVVKERHNRPASRHAVMLCIENIRLFYTACSRKGGEKKDVFNLAWLCDHDITFSEPFQIGMAAAV